VESLSRNTDETSQIRSWTAYRVLPAHISHNHCEKCERNVDPAAAGPGLSENPEEFRGNRFRPCWSRFLSRSSRVNISQARRTCEYSGQYPGGAVYSTLPRFCEGGIQIIRRPMLSYLAAVVGAVSCAVFDSNNSGAGFGSGTAPMREPFLKRLR
jgi:hypothetical protein